ncbi:MULTISPECIES: regulatory signaling modulator protein AmpE [unclassified Pseudomonas]|uniref:regulatory signaling modulator protein AmpE n=1 Tax=unclassified Pseudomonas TaxID=196821 RepID=UPI000F03C85D|nr:MULTISPECIES: regulatory signaling modulator protein AmpE [unclassified Pseudomonas]MBD8593835.1 regulatory signaling modulator protein AmpE [Pseudomonas sp. CFBP 8758]MBD8623654.1 regulatory signaling modulator protein AmpE [Pseudomonas sp. CFBP 13727]MBD8731427.1 regulatory signaling modulator protein AmpE [Pseudomonas sp. CFBP 13710]
MIFLVLLLVLLAEKFSGLRQRVQRDGFFLGELHRLEARPGLAREPWLVLGIGVALPALLLAFVLYALQPVAYGLLALPVHLLVLIYSLGRGDITVGLGPFRDAWRREDTQAAVHVAERDMGVIADNGGSLLQRVQGHLLWEAYQSFFAVIFWYAALGPVAALVYRLVALVAEQSRHPAIALRAQRLRHALDWLPVRLLAASFALVGNFVAVSRVMLHEVLSWEITAAALIDRVGRVAGDVPAPVVGQVGVETLDSLWQMVVRAGVLWYAVLAVCSVLA